MTKRRSSAPVIAVIAVLVCTDLATKRWAVAALSEAPVELPGPVDLQLAYNSGTAFGLFSNIPPTVVSIVVLAFVGAVLNLWRTHRAPTIPTVLIVAGGLANSIDRFEAGSVVDMIHTGWWPTFNVADIFINAGVACWIAKELFHSDTAATNPPKQTEDTTV